MAIDSVGGNDAVLENFGLGNAQWIAGMFNGALNFTNQDAYAITTSPIASDVLTVTFWSRLNGNITSNDSVLLTPQGDNWITYNRSGGKGIGIGSVRDLQQPLQGVWENYTVTLDRSAGTAAVYRDGVLRATGAVSLPALHSRWVFGHNQDPGNTNGSWNGALDEVQFYDSALSPADIAALASRPPQRGIAAHLVAPAQRFGSQPTGEYAAASTTFFVNPAMTKWIAWNRFTDLRAVSDSRPGELFLGAFAPEVDDHFELTITNPAGRFMTVALDQNGVLGAPIGPQSMIFGESSAAPDVVRGDNFGAPSFFDEVGQFNSLFDVSGEYKFDFSFRNIGGDAGYPDVYVLVNTVPEPTSAMMAAAALFAVCCSLIPYRVPARRCVRTRDPLRE